MIVAAGIFIFLWSSVRRMGVAPMSIESNFIMDRALLLLFGRSICKNCLDYYSLGLVSAEFKKPCGILRGFVFD